MLRIFLTLSSEEWEAAELASNGNVSSMKVSEEGNTTGIEIINKIREIREGVIMTMIH